MQHAGDFERLDEYFVLLALEVGLDVAHFATYLPLNNKIPPAGKTVKEYKRWEAETLNHPLVLKKLQQHIEPKENLIYAAAKQMHDERKASFSPSVFRNAMERYSNARRSFLKSLHIPCIGNKALLPCQNSSFIAALPPLMGGASNMGRPGGTFNTEQQLHSIW